jgi:3-methylfumaryl-CoA hydratase
VAEKEGVTIERTDLLDAGPADRFADLLGVAAPDLAGGQALPLLWHWLYALERPARTDLGPDGHPVRGGVPTPPGPGMRRMWAGGSVTTSAPLRGGVPVVRRTRVIDETVKEGRSGRLVFVAVEHQISQHDRLAVRERQDLVYREASTPPAARSRGEPACDGADVADAAEVGPEEWEVSIDPILLFRFSALTWNSHRIHYDRDYATDVEGYPGLVTHGPLQALAMAEAARRRGIDGAVDHRFDYRLVSPLYDHQGLVTACTPTRGGGAELSVRDIWGRQTATGRLVRL